MQEAGNYLKRDVEGRWTKIILLQKSLEYGTDILSTTDNQNTYWLQSSDYLRLNVEIGYNSKLLLINYQWKILGFIFWNKLTYIQDEDFGQETTFRLLIRLTRCII